MRGVAISAKPRTRSRPQLTLWRQRRFLRGTGAGAGARQGPRSAPSAAVSNPGEGVVSSGLAPCSLDLGFCGIPQEPTHAPCIVRGSRPPISPSPCSAGLSGRSRPQRSATPASFSATAARLFQQRHGDQRSGTFAVAQGFPAGHSRRPNETQRRENDTGETR